MNVIDFTELKKRKKTYAGANGNKISVIYEGEQYMLKFPPQVKLNKNMSYSNSCFSEGKERQRREITFRTYKSSI